MQKPSALASDELRAIQQGAGREGAGVGPRPGEHLAPRSGESLPILPGIAGRHSVSRSRSSSSAFPPEDPRALRALLPRFPADFPMPIAIVLAYAGVGLHCLPSLINSIR